MKEIVKNAVQNDELITEVYRDALQPSFKQVGKMGEGLLKFVALPFSFLGMTAEQLEEKYKKFIAEVVNKVPEEKREKPKAVIASPLLDHMKYLFDDEEDNNLVKLFSELLANAINSDRKDQVHVSYIQTIMQLGSLEAEILEKMYGLEFDIDYLGVVFKTDIKKEVLSLNVLSDEPEPLYEYEEGYSNVFFYKYVIVMDNDELKVPYDLLKEVLNILEHHNLIESFRINKYKDKDEYSLEKHDRSNINDMDPYGSMFGYSLTPYGRDFMSVCVDYKTNIHSTFRCKKCNGVFINVNRNGKCSECGSEDVELL